MGDGRGNPRGCLLGKLEAILGEGTGSVEENGHRLCRIRARRYARHRRAPWSFSYDQCGVRDALDRHAQPVDSGTYVRGAGSEVDLGRGHPQHRGSGTDSSLVSVASSMSAGISMA